MARVTSRAVPGPWRISRYNAPFLFDLLPTVNDNYWDLTTIRHAWRASPSGLGVGAGL